MRLRSTPYRISPRTPQAGWQATLSQAGGLVYVDAPMKRQWWQPLTVCLCVPAEHVQVSELWLPQWLNEQALRDEVLLHAQGVLADQSQSELHHPLDASQALNTRHTWAASTSSISSTASTTANSSTASPLCVDAHPNTDAQSDQGLQLWHVYTMSERDMMLHWAACCAQHAQPQQSWCCVAAVPEQAQHMGLNLLPYREQAARGYARRSWACLGASVVCMAGAMFGAHAQLPTQTRGVDVQPVAQPPTLSLAQTPMSMGDANQHPTLTALRAQVLDLQQRLHVQQWQRQWQQWQLDVLQALPRDTTAHIAVHAFEAKAQRISITGASSDLSILATWSNALRARWSRSLSVQLLNTQRGQTGHIQFELVLIPIETQGNTLGVQP
jgi:hypothetical protein